MKMLTVIKLQKLKNLNQKFQIKFLLKINQIEKT